MSFSANIPALGNKIIKDVPDQNALNQRMMRCDFSDVVDLPVGTKALVESAEGWEVRQFNGTGWVLLERWNIDAQKVDGHSASTGTTANTIPVRDSSGKLPGDITGNAATASKAKALSETNPVAVGGTGATTAEQARANLGTPPKKHAASSTEYGAGTSTLYGHLKSHDEPDSTLTAASGHAFSPAGAAAMREALGGLLGETRGAVSELDTSLRALIAEEVAKCLPLTGGEMKGTIIRNGFLAQNSVDDNLLIIRGGTDATSAFLGLCGKRHSNKGMAYMTASDGTQTATFSVNANGVAKMAGNTVITSAGGTLTGGLTGTAYTQKLSSIDVTATPSTSAYGEPIRFNDKNNKLFAMLQPVQWNNGNNALRFIVAKKDGTQGCVLGIEQKKDGTSAFTWNGSTLPTLVASWRSGANWYRKWSDGFIEQGGDYRNEADWGFNTITLHTAFATTDYFVVGQEWQYKWNSNDHKPNTMLKSKSTTSFSLETFNPGSLWYACGY